ncbi:MAG TPA: hypothetical protein VFX16_14330 [Pseudonocardiaceae bacterium]|nr:hypothetical protein [Pseudonocardiaceae bacterium]
MSKIVLILRDPESPEANMRCESFGSFLSRLWSVEGEPAELVSSASDPVSAMTRLAATGGLVGDGEKVRYVPSGPARERVVAERDGLWPQALVSRHRKAIRRSEGAIFRLPLVAEDASDSSAGQNAGTVDAFVTDWTGIPGACAIAVHPAHPLSTGIGPGETISFTGRFCRHPLSGDLLPVWVADWVKPEFGTGAVLINPAHNKMDFEFSRQAGLPIRFALVPEGYDGSPESWLNPPFIKSGFAVRSGVAAADGLPFDRVREIYFSVIARYGLTEQHTDTGVGAFLVAAMASDGGVEVSWDRHRRTIAGSGRPGEPVRLDVSSVFGAAEERIRAAELTVVTPSTQVEGDLFALRLMLSEPEIAPVVEKAPAVVVVGNALPVKDAVDHDVLRLALLVNAGTLETVSLKPQQIEPCERFLKAHESLAAIHPVAGQDTSPALLKAAKQIKDLLTARNLRQAFTPLYRMQKGLVKSETVGEPDLAVYLSLAYVLAGVGGSVSAETMAATWQRI